MKGSAKHDPMWAFFERCAKDYDPEKVANGLRHFMAECEALEANEKAAATPQKGESQER